ncbi:hypothetical protein HPP92_015104 [Vanilla planifolia]|uniref:RRM domain-containing protein n=1 Tax=Vanilla planifolia TaxID=51239 RepID=A0A835UVG6_VANPL|nr:hypothetical protein HPP92_015616 [Vanilla planifolia]KAG0475418.1 hypothetical protein HPP92_015104 [Vanilla planifolia]
MAKKKKAAAARIVENNEEEDDEEDEEEDDEQNSYDSLEEDSAEDDDDLEEFGEDEDDDFSSKESIINLLDPFGKEQLLAIVKDAALKHPSLLYRVLDAANADPVHRNIFVHGLGWDATSKTLTDAFSPFGEIEECKVVGDRVTGRCKGYGFVLFRSRVAAQRALKEPQKQIGNRTASCQLAAAGPPPAAGQGSYLIPPVGGSS